MFENLLRCWWAAAELRPWRAQEVQSMAVGYPSFRSIVRRRHRDFRRLLGFDLPQTLQERVDHEQCGEFVLAWRGRIEPFARDASLSQIQAIIADLDEDRPVIILADGRLGHYGDCRGNHRPRQQFRLARGLYDSFEVEIAYRRPPGCPIAHALAPRIDRNHPSGPPPHLLNTIDALCVLFPADGDWVWEQHGARDYADFTSIWLAKHLAWVESRERGFGIDEAWPGSFVGHDPHRLLRSLRPHEGCRCGSGLRYGDCCALEDAAAATADAL